MIMTVDADQLTLEPLGDVGEARAEWASLASASGNPFATVEWCEAWLEHAAAGAEPRLFAAVYAGETVAIVPLVIVRGRYVRKARFLGYGAANELGPVCAVGDLDRGVAALRLALEATGSEWDVFHGETLPGAGWPKRLDATLVGREGSPVVTGPWPTWDDYLATRSHNFRSELRRKERRLLEEGLVGRTVSERDELVPALDALFDLHRRRWGAEASPFFAGLEAFHRAFSKVALERGWLRLRVFELDGAVISVTHGFRFVDSEWSYQFGRDPEFDRSSLGLIASAQAIRGAFAEGAHDFKLGPGRQDYKLRFATGDPGLETVGIARGLRGRASLIAAKRRGG
jgi:CelD/BcsL family acetyltransferase involved in cellulose biosynthesis